MDHTSGGQRAADVEATGPDPWAALERIVDHLSLTGHYNHDDVTAVREAMARGARLVTSRDAPPPGAVLVHGRSDRPPFAEDLVAERPPHEQSS